MKIEIKVEVGLKKEYSLSGHSKKKGKYNKYVIKEREEFKQLFCFYFEETGLTYADIFTKEELDRLDAVLERKKLREIECEGGK